MKCIYKIENKENGKVYIGQTVNYTERRKAHLKALKRGNHYNRYLQKSFDKYGVTSFSFSVIEETDELDEREMYWIKHFNSVDCSFGYNLTSGGKKFIMNESTKRLISNSLKKSFSLNDGLRKEASLRTTGEKNPFYGRAHSEETKEKILKNRSWYRHSEETKMKMSEKKKGKKHPNYGKKFSEEWRKNLSESHKGQKPANLKDFPPYEIEDMKEMYKGGKTLKDIADKYNVSNVPIRRVLTEAGLYKPKNPRKPLTEKQLEEITALLNGGKSLNQVAKLYGLTPQGLKKKLIKNNLI